MKPTVHFLETTLKDIEKSGHTPEDIIFIGSERTGHQCTWAEFQELCKQQEKDLTVFYDAAYDLIIVFKDGIKMDRANNDRGWEDFRRYQKPFVMPTQKKVIKKLFGDHDSLDDIHGELKEQE